MYTVKLEQFQGPLDLLLQLTEEKKLDITEISLAKVTDQYVAYLRNLENVSLEDLANFLVIASRLILIKSRMILPSLELTEEEEQDIDALKKQLEEYKKFKDLAKQLDELAKIGNITYGREKYQGLRTIFYPPKNFDLNDLKTAFKKVLEEIFLLEEKLPEETIKLKISLEEKIKQVQEELKDKIQTTFHKLTKKTNSKIDIIVSFLALLELIKQQIIFAKQDNLYDDIIIGKL